MYRIMIVGAGYAGLAIAKHLTLKKQKVFGLTRSSVKAARLDSFGITPILADLTKTDTLKQLPPANFIVLSPAPDERNEESYRKIYLEGIGNYLRAIRHHPAPHLIVHLSSIGVYGQQQGEWVDEQTPLKAETERERILIEAEREILKSGFDAVIFRLGGIYGPERNRFAQIQNPDWSFPKTDRYLNMIHVEDIAGATAVLFKHASVGNVYLGVDDEPVKELEFYRWLFQKAGRKFENPAAANEKIPVLGRRCRNHKLKKLGFSFVYPTFREGYEASFSKIEVG